MNCVNVNVDRMKACVIKSKHGIMINVGVSVKNKMIEVFGNMIICGILVRVIVSVMSYEELKNI